MGNILTVRIRLSQCTALLDNNTNIISYEEGGKVYPVSSRP